MTQLQAGDIVARKSYGCDVYFKVVDIRENAGGTVAVLKGIDYRIQADAPMNDLILMNENNVREYREKNSSVVTRKKREVGMSPFRGNPKRFGMRESRTDAKRFLRMGTVLHLDGDSEYMKRCLEQYAEFEIPVVGRYVPEKEQPLVVYNLLKEVKPDILVLTGHDGVLKGNGNYKNLNNYRNSSYFIEAVKEARRYENDMDSLIIFAGACQSLYQNILDAGANYASSPERVLIHALDPVFVCQKITNTGADKMLQPMDVIKHTITGMKGIGGVQTRGKQRSGFPVDAYK